MAITIKSPSEIAIMLEGGRILAKILDELTRNVKPGAALKDLDKLAEELVLRYGAESSFKGYRPFDAAGQYPAVICSSINDEVVHCVPSERALKEGDILSIDFGVKYKGFHTDAAVTVPVGAADPEALRLLRVTKKAMKLGIKKVRPGNTVGDIGNTIQRFVESQGFYVIKELVGHGIGRALHEEPEIPNWGKRHKGAKLTEGMVICIEPMVAMGTDQIIRGKDGFLWKTADGSLSAHFEHTIAVTNIGHEILTIL